MKKKYSGVLMHISCLPSNYGIGTFGIEARKFVDFLVSAGQSYWQILPLGQTSFGDSPYQSFSTFAGNPYFIDLDYLIEDGLLLEKEVSEIDWESDEEHVNYGVLYNKRYPLLRKAVTRFQENDDYQVFCKKNDWLNDYAYFMAIKNKFNGCDWLHWPKNYRLKDKETLEEFEKENEEEIHFWKVVQYLFFHQWMDLKKYANERGVKIFGDCPIYVALDSVDVWANRDIFKLKKNGIPREVAGVPPDAFSDVGQLWGNPLYNWSYLKKNHYDWWIKRIKHQLTLLDALRIDHFIGFESYYAVKYGEVDARNGKRYKGPGYSLIKAIKENVKDGEIIAEDLGIVTDNVRKLLKRSKYPGMKVLRFGFDGNMENDHLTHFHKYNSVVYITSHDSETCKQWQQEADPKNIEFARNYCKMDPDENFNWGMIKELERSPAYLVIVMMQDLLELGDEARMNFPGTMGVNWAWRMKKGACNKDIAKRLKTISKENKRVHKH